MWMGKAHSNLAMVQQRERDGRDGKKGSGVCHLGDALRRPPQQDVSPAPGHVGRYRHRAQPPGLRDDLALALHVLRAGVEHLDGHE